jgi:hypothetical protein
VLANTNIEFKGQGRLHDAMIGIRYGDSKDFLEAEHGIFNKANGSFGAARRCRWR